MTPYAKPRFITDPEIIRKILDRCKIIHLGMQEDGHVYVVPTNYGYTYEDGKLTFLFPRGHGREKVGYREKESGNLRRN